ncbi:MAG: RnfABCDGE type electron transport complex subunit D [Burkholderiales bacterium]|nr:RnfABCDGE type electron transport complex subunit D [Burkholderiales bacterium]
MPLAAIAPISIKVDARWFQIAFLLSLLLFGAVAREFSITSAQLGLTFAAALLTQAAWQWGLRLQTRASWQGYLSAFVSACGMSILVRADNLWVHPLLACIAMSSKYLVRAGPPESTSHVFNPANLAAVLALTALPGAWLSPGQWGSDVLLALWLIALGGIVTHRISRWDVSVVFLGTWGALLAARLAWLEYDWTVGHAIWLQQISNGATLLFAFFMISDPMTIPQQARARMGYAICIAVGAFVWQYLLFKPHGLIIALAVGSLLVPLANWRWRAQRFDWSR